MLIKQRTVNASLFSQVTEEDCSCILQTVDRYLVYLVSCFHFHGEYSEQNLTLAIVNGQKNK